MTGKSSLFVITIKPAWEGEVPTEPNCSTLFWLSRSFALLKKARTIKSELLRMTFVQGKDKFSVNTVQDLRKLGKNEYAMEARMERIDLQGQPMNLDLTLSCGQAFRWCKRSDGVWAGVVKDKLVELDTEDGCLLWRTYPHGDRALVEDYLRLSEDVNAVYWALSHVDPHLADLTQQFSGLRFLRQDPTEALLSFVCSAANSIPRIMNSVEELAVAYGELICEVGGSCYYAFPTPEAIAAADPEELDDIPSLGFRSRNIRTVALQLVGRGEGWLHSLRAVSYAEAKNALVELRGVGPKIADCVCLFSLDKDEAVPVDTHVRQLAHRLFLPEIKARTITDSVYRRITWTFHERYGKYAGWAQQFLFYEDLLRTRSFGRGQANGQHLRTQTDQYRACDDQ